MALISPLINSLSRGQRLNGSEKPNSFFTQRHKCSTLEESGSGREGWEARNVGTEDSETTVNCLL